MEKVLTAAIGTILAAVAALVVEWARADSRLASLPRTLEDHIKACQFVDGWTKTYLQIASLPDGPGKDLAKEYAELLLRQSRDRLAASDARATVSAVANETRSVFFAIADFVRLRKPIRAWLWFFQLPYYAAVALGIRLAVTEKKIFSLPMLICLVVAFFGWSVCWAVERQVRAPRT